MNQPNPRCIEWWAAESPDEVAVVEGEGSLTWAALDDLANRVANALQRAASAPATSLPCAPGRASSGQSWRGPSPSSAARCSA